MSLRVVILVLGMLALAPAAWAHGGCCQESSEAASVAFSGGEHRHTMQASDGCCTGGVCGHAVEARDECPCESECEDCSCTGCGAAPAPSSPVVLSAGVGSWPVGGGEIAFEIAEQVTARDGAGNLLRPPIA